MFGIYVTKYILEEFQSADDQLIRGKTAINHYILHGDRRNPIQPTSLKARMFRKAHTKMLRILVRETIFKMFIKKNNFQHETCDQEESSRLLKFLSTVTYKTLWIRFDCNQEDCSES